MIELHTYPPCWGLSTLTPFGIKVETFLRLTRLSYTVVIENNPRKGPYNKMPLIIDGKDTIADSTLILSYLANKYQLTIDNNLSHAQKALAHSCKVMLEEHLYFIMLYSRWVAPSGFAVIKQAFMPMFPFGLRHIAIVAIRRMLKRQAYHQGIGRLDRNSVYQMGIDDLEALAQLMATEGFFFGEQPHSIDAAVYAFLTTLQKTPIDTPIKKTASKPRFLNYCATVEDYLSQ